MNASSFGHQDPSARRDAEHLRLLAVFHFISSGLSLLGLGALGLHAFLFQSMLSNPNFAEKAPPAPPPEVWQLLSVFYAGFGAFLALGLVLNLLSAIFIRKRKHRIFSIVAAVFNCVHVPVGTALGVFTLITLTKESVRNDYARTA